MREPERLQAGGTGQLQQCRFGALPRIPPLFVSDLLYCFESNARSATIVGPLGAGGIGLKLIETIQTRQDWENTLYLIILIKLVVIAMDTASDRLRRKLIGSVEGG